MIALVHVSDLRPSSDWAGARQSNAFGLECDEATKARYSDFSTGDEGQA
jgi:hypothetical protein